MIAPSPIDDVAGTDRPPRFVWIVVLVLLAVAAGGFAQYLARNGVVSTPDSVVYEGTAANLRAGRGITSPISTVAVDIAPDQAIREAGRIPLVQFPPLFPAALAVLEAFGLSPRDAARALNPTLLGVNVLLAGLVVVSALGTRRWKWALPVIALMLTGVPRLQRSPLLLLHGSVLSEPMMIAFVLGSLLALLRFVRRPSPTWLLVAAGLASLATATRFVGVAMAITVVVAAWLWGPARRAARLGWSAAAAVVGIAPTVVVIAVNEASLRGHGHPPAVGSPVKAFEQLATGLTQWFVPTTAPTVLRVAFLAALVVLAGFVVHDQTPAFRLRGNEAVTRRARPVLVLLAFVYLIVVVASRLTFDQNVALWGRHLELLWILVLVVAVDLVSAADRDEPIRRGFVLGAATLAAIAIVTPGARDMPALVRSGYQPGRAAPSPRFARAIEAVPRREVIFSNVPDGVYATAGRPALMVPCRLNYYTQHHNPHYQSDLSQMLALLHSHRAALVLDTLSPLGEGSCFDGHDAAARGLRLSQGFASGGLYTVR